MTEVKGLVCVGRGVLYHHQWRVFRCLFLTEMRVGVNLREQVKPCVSGDGEVQNFNYVYEAAECVTTGLKDLYHSKKDYSIHGLPVKLQVLGVKLLPHSLIMNIWLNQQKTPRNNHGLTSK